MKSQDADLGSPIKRHQSREKSISTVRGVFSSPSVVRIGVVETNQHSHPISSYAVVSFEFSMSVSEQVLLP